MNLSPLRVFRGRVSSMLTSTIKFAGIRALHLFLLASLLSIPVHCAAAQKSGAEQTLFASPDEALQALVAAAQAKDRTTLAAIYGPDYNKLLSGDDVEDNKDLDDFAASLSESAQLQKDSDARYTVLAGKTNWPSPIPIVQDGDKWRFDTDAGLDEILNRRIGDNELAAILTCRAYVIAQWQYFLEDSGGEGINQYAQKFISTLGSRDGLYWDVPEGEDPSPLGALVAAARAEGYDAEERAVDAAAAAQGKAAHRPFHGYYFKILKRQGLHAPGGKYNYVINGHMIAGYALIAYPAKWGDSGVMTFIVNQQGRVYQKNLGPKTDQIAAAIVEYDPDATWSRVHESDFGH
jgi:hypothetical protein